MGCRLGWTRIYQSCYYWRRRHLRCLDGSFIFKQSYSRLLSRVLADFDGNGFDLVWFNSNIRILVFRFRFLPHKSIYEDKITLANHLDNFDTTIDSSPYFLLKGIYWEYIKPGCSADCEGILFLIEWNMSDFLISDNLTYLFYHFLVQLLLIKWM